MEATAEQQTDTDRHLLTFSEAGRIVGLSRMTVAKWVDAGELPAVRMPKSRSRRVRRGVFLEFVESLEE